MFSTILTTRTREHINSIRDNTVDNKHMKYDQSSVSLRPRYLTAKNAIILPKALHNKNTSDAKIPSSSTNKRKMINIFSCLNLPKIRLIRDRGRLNKRRRFNNSNTKFNKVMLQKNNNNRLIILLTEQNRP